VEQIKNKCLNSPQTFYTIDFQDAQHTHVIISLPSANLNNPDRVRHNFPMNTPSASRARSWSLPNKLKNRFHSARAKLASSRTCSCRRTMGAHSLTLAPVSAMLVCIIYYIIHTHSCAYGYIIRSIRNQLCVHKPHLHSLCVTRKRQASEPRGKRRSCCFWALYCSALSPRPFLLWCCRRWLDPIILAHLYTCFHDSPEKN
jgi:hypothetical protein